MKRVVSRLCCVIQKQRYITRIYINIIYSVTYLDRTSVFIETDIHTIDSHLMSQQWTVRGIGTTVFFSSSFIASIACYTISISNYHTIQKKLFCSLIPLHLPSLFIYFPFYLWLGNPTYTLHCSYQNIYFINIRNCVRSKVIDEVK